jgi:hypothetical protein
MKVPMKKQLGFLFISLALIPAMAWSSCDQAKIYESDEVLSLVECKSSKLKGCMLKAFTKEGREYVGVRVESAGTKVVQVYKWLDLPNNENAKYWEASRLSKLTNLSSQYPGRVTKAEYWRVDNKLHISVDNFVSGKVLFSAELDCK